MKTAKAARVGGTPLVPLKALSSLGGPTIYAKAEMHNPTGSVKDRLAEYLIDAAVREGRLEPGGTVVEATSGNTGISVAWICAARGYRAVIVMSDKNSNEKREMMAGFGAELIITPHTAKPDDPRSSYRVAERLNREIDRSVYLDQFNNPANIRCHYETTGPEIWSDTNGSIDCLIAGAGTGGTISGAGRFLKERNRKIRIIAVDSEGSIFRHYFETGKLIEAGHYEVEGIGGDKVVGALDFDVIDNFLTIGDKEAFLTTRELAARANIRAGGSSGATLAAARKILAEDKYIRHPVIIMADSGDRYVSKIFNERWMAENGYL